MLRNKLLLLVLILVLAIETNYCSDNNPIPKDQNANSNAMSVDSMENLVIAVDTLGTYIFYHVCSNFVYWLFGLYQKKPKMYWCKYYRAFGRRTRLFSNRFYFDFYMRTWISIPLALFAFFSYKARKEILRDSDITDERECICICATYLYLIKLFLCFILVPVVDLNICLGKNFNLVIGFRDIIIAYFQVKTVSYMARAISLGRQREELSRAHHFFSQIENINQNE